VQLAPDDLGIRCLRCGASAITLSLMAVLVETRPGFRGESVYELSARGPLYTFLRRRVRDLTASEYFDDVPPGQYRGSVLCQDVQRLTFADGTFDVCTSTEVFEHVAEDRQAFGEIRRVLKPGGQLMFTVPLMSQHETVERARLEGGRLVHLLPPEYHGDHVRGRARVLTFRNYGLDVIERLRAAGFSDAAIDRRAAERFFGHGRGVVVAWRDPRP
jgi:SAM-dependent methyltransferase